MSSRIQRAILSVTDKAGLVDFAGKLSDLGIELVSTGGTAKLLRDSGIAVKDISDLTGFPEMLDGRVKTLHPKVHGGILHRREDAKHVAAVKEHGIQPIDMVVVNLYAFEKTAAKPGVAFEELIENIDIGGPSMIRSAAKNFHDVAIVTSPSDYDSIAAELGREGGALSKETRWRLAQKAFATTAAYDSAIASTLERISPQSVNLQSDSAAFPSTLRFSFHKALDLRYGENPHQKAAMYSDGSSEGVANARQLQGKELSYNNIVDLQAAWDLAQEFDEPVCAIIKHTNPCGTATGKILAEAYKRALECDPVSAFGGVIGVNRPVNAEAAEEMHKLFLEVIAAPAFDEAAKAKFASKKNLRLVEVIDSRSPGRIRPEAGQARNWVLKNISGGLLVQDADVRPLQDADLKVVTKRPPTPEETRALLFAWKVCKHVKSNAIVYARDGQTVGVGAGQMSRVDSAKIGAMKAQLPLKGTVAASDAFFPFPDGVEEIAKAGATAVIQPGGSQRDPEVIEAADRLGLAMLFTGVRHFRH
ncbi:MAG TPA: bifunctional phosphoribosylaminoimidazolecarboxamide formyltransferase/IMP cyclohydrolase [Candidatus Dormibacteraeota bacterium]|nr:bifunctional phosphoribosylaminoimidazolecarboxamide formyltransferase/IMP cyclohydrolase [Candidatus Dormibacteraeota bacterium]